MSKRNAEELRKWFSKGKQKTRNGNAIKLSIYCEWIHRTPGELKQEYTEARTKSVDAFNEWRRKTQNKALEFYNHLKDQGYSINYCRSIPLGILAFYSENCERVSGVTKDFDAPQIPKNEYVFTQEVLRKMHYYGSPFEKTWPSKREWTIYRAL